MRGIRGLVAISIFTAAIGIIAYFVSQTLAIILVAATVGFALIHMEILDDSDDGYDKT